MTRKQYCEACRYDMGDIRVLRSIIANISRSHERRAKEESKPYVANLKLAEWRLARRHKRSKR